MHYNVEMSPVKVKEEIKLTGKIRISWTRCPRTRDNSTTGFPAPVDENLLEFKKYLKLFVQNFSSL